MKKAIKKPITRKSGKFPRRKSVKTEACQFTPCFIAVHARTLYRMVIWVHGRTARDSCVWSDNAVIWLNQSNKLHIKLIESFLMAILCPIVLLRKIRLPSNHVLKIPRPIVFFPVRARAHSLKFSHIILGSIIGVTSERNLCALNYMMRGVSPKLGSIKYIIQRIWTDRQASGVFQLER